MAKTYEELLEQAAIIRDETAAGKNTATRVGGTITDAVDYVKELQDTYKGIHAEAAAAKEAAAAAKSTASEAKMNATAAMNTARSASLNATAASGTANEAKAAADLAKTESAQAVSTAQDAKDTADAAKSELDIKVNNLTQESSEKTYLFAEAFTISGLVNTDGSWNTKGYTSAFHTDYIDITKFESIVGKGLWNNTKITWPAAFYDENHVFLYGLTGNTIDASKSLNPTAKYVVFQGESEKTNASYTAITPDGAITQIRKDLEKKANIGSVPSNEEFDKVKGDVEEIVGFENRDITNDVTWTNGRFDAKDDPLTSVVRGYNTAIPWSSGKAAEFEVTDYDEIHYKNALSIKDYANVGYLIGDGNLLLTIIGNWNGSASHPDNEGTIDLTEFKGYSKLTLKINGSQVQEKWPDMQNVIITATKHGISKDDKKVAKKIVLNGDSLCNKLGVQLMRICHAFGYDLLNRTRGGEKIIGNLTRAGGISCRIAQQFTMPSSGSVNIKITTTWARRSGEYAGEPISWTKTNGEIFWIKNIKGILKKIVMPQVVVYNSSKSVIKTYNEGGNNVLPSNSSFIRININTEETTATPHVTVGSTPLDIDSVCVLNGYVETNGSVNSDSRYKTSDFIPVAASQIIYIDGCATIDEYTFEREETGESVIIGEGTFCFFNRLISDKDFVHIWFSGQNGGFEDADDYAEMTNSAARSFGENFIVMTTHTANCGPAIIRASTAKFGNKYLNIRDYLCGNAINDAVRFGLLDASYIGRDWEEVMLDAQKVHQSDVCAYLEAVQIWNRLVDLQMVEGERVDSGAYFIDGEQNISKWYGVPEMGYGINWPFTDM